MYIHNYVHVIYIYIHIICICMYIQRERERGRPTSLNILRGDRVSKIGHDWP